MLIMDLWQKQKGNYFCICTRSLTGKWKEHFFKRGRWMEAKRFIADNKDKDLYMCPHGLTEPKRQKPFSVDPYLLYADLDECDPRKLAVKPTIAIESSPGRFVGYWVTDKPASEELNRRLAYSFGADISGWDRTQVLRIPHTRNYKYPSKPLVKILWDDGPEYELSRLESLIPQTKTVKHEDVDEKAKEVYRKYEDKLPRWARKELISGNPRVGNRSEVIWKLQNACLEIGMTRDEVFDLVWASPWNKFKDRSNGADQLWRELDKAIDQHFAEFKKEREESKKWNPLPAPISETEIENIEWLVPGFIAKRELCIVEGDPGLGKSYFMQVLAGLVCDGKPIPCLPHYDMTEGRVAYFDTENTASTVTKSRLDENKIKNQCNYFQGEEGFSIDDEERWTLVLERLEHLKPQLVVFDTINSYIGGTDTYRSSETQQAMGFFKDIAVRFNCAVVILRHLTKGGSGGKAIYRGQGSIAFTGAARTVATVGRLPDDDNVRVVACTKNNIGPAFQSFTYTIEGLPDTKERKNRSRLIWGEVVDLSADEMINAPTGEKNNDKETAMKWLKKELSGGRIEQSKIQLMAEARGISKSILTRVADSLGIVKDQTGFGKNKKSWWSLPQSA